MNNLEFHKIVKQFQKTSNVDSKRLNVHELLIFDNGTVFKHNFRNQSEKSDIRSISKTVMTLILGIFLEENKDYNLDSYIYPIIKDSFHLSNQANLPYLQKIKIKHLLTHTIGYDDVLMMRGSIVDPNSEDLLESLLNHPIVHQPGSKYLYSNAGFYLLSVLIELLVQEPFLDYADRVFFSRLGIIDYEWEKYGAYCAGATRLWLHGDDLLKIGIMLLNKGRWDNHSIISEKWIDTITRPFIETPEVDTPDRYFRRFAYGYGLWLGHDDYFFGHGTDGQILVILPKQNRVILTLSHEVNISLIEDLVNSII